MLFFDQPPPAIIRPAPKEIIRPGDPRFITPEEAGIISYVRKTGSALAVASIQHLTDATNGTVYTWTNQAISGAFSHLILCPAARGSAAGRTVSTLTVAGVGATSLLHNLNGNQSAGIWIIAHTTSPATIVVTWDGACDTTGLGIIAVSGLISTTPDDTSISDSNQLHTLDLDIPAGGLIVAHVLGAGGASTVTWTGATEQWDTAPEGIPMSGATHTTVAAEAARAVSANHSVGTQVAAGVAASFR